MGLRFRKTINLGIIRVTFCKTGISYSVGSKCYRVTKRADGRIQKTYTVPKTGISYTDIEKKKDNKDIINIDKKYIRFKLIKLIAWITLTYIFTKMLF